MSNRREKNKKKQVYITLLVEIFLCVVCLLAITAALYFAFEYNAEKIKEESASSELEKYSDPLNPYYSEEETSQMVEQAKQDSYERGYEKAKAEIIDNIRMKLLESNSSLDTFRSIFPDELIVIDKSKYYMLPINNSLKKHDFKTSDFTRDDRDRIQYTGNAYKAETGIDVSKYQGKISWSKVAKDDIDFAIIRLGIRGYSKGGLMDDDTFEYNIENALDEGIGVGVYFFTQATSNSEAIEEAQYVLDKLEPYNVTYPVILDVELVGGDEGRGNNLNMADRTEYAITFCETIKKAGYKPMIYGNLKTFLLMLDMEKLEDYPKWYADYTDYPYIPYDFDMWQYTDTAVVNGIDDPVDLNIFFTDK